VLVIFFQSTDFSVAVAYFENGPVEAVAYVSGIELTSRLVALDMMKNNTAVLL
jgi:hypothetical protein